MKFIVYEIWTRSHTIEASSIEKAYDKGEPKPQPGLCLSNWHIVPLGIEKDVNE